MVRSITFDGKEGYIGSRYTDDDKPVKPDEDSMDTNDLLTSHDFLMIGSGFFHSFGLDYYSYAYIDLNSMVQTNTDHKKHFMLVKAVIPKGSVYYRGTMFDQYKFASSSLIIHKPTE